MTEEKESGAESDDVLQAAEKSFNEDKREDEWRNGIRERNRNTVWKGGQGGMDLSTRDRNIQKTQKLKGIIKRMADNERDSLLSGIKQLDLSMYISEFADAISDSNFKLKDIQSVVQLCSELHVRYEDFSKSLVDGLMKRFVAAESDTCAEPDPRVLMWSICSRGPQGWGPLSQVGALQRKALEFLMHQ
eukprot:GHVU01070296.1.p1 GENE.GHVU01070296.1~~GHVU01070296.1.p1  ORF type:complete len:189 (-),score=24.20 GHVU01070296.1:476-1042(-)